MNYKAYKTAQQLAKSEKPKKTRNQKTRCLKQNTNLNCMKHPGQESDTEILMKGYFNSVTPVMPQHHLKLISFSKSNKMHVKSFTHVKNLNFLDLSLEH